MPLDIYLTATSNAHRNKQLLLAAVRKIHHNGGGTLHIAPGLFFESDTVILPAGVRLMYHPDAPWGGGDGAPRHTGRLHTLHYDDAGQVVSGVGDFEGDDDN